MGACDIVSVDECVNGNLHIRAISVNGDGVMRFVLKCRSYFKSNSLIICEIFLM